MCLIYTQERRKRSHLSVLNKEALPAVGSAMPHLIKRLKYWMFTSFSLEIAHGRATKNQQFSGGWDISAPTSRGGRSSLRRPTLDAQRAAAFQRTHLLRPRERDQASTHKGTAKSRDVRFLQARLVACPGLSQSSAARHLVGRGRFFAPAGDVRPEHAHARDLQHPRPLRRQQLEHVLTCCTGRQVGGHTEHAVRQLHMPIERSVRGAPVCATLRNPHSKGLHEAHNSYATWVSFLLARTWIVAGGGRLAFFHNASNTRTIATCSLVGWEALQVERIPHNTFKML